MAKSAFSSAAALFNPNCVVYEPFWFGKLGKWAVLNASLPQMLPGCLKG